LTKLHTDDLVNLVIVTVVVVYHGDIHLTTMHNLCFQMHSILGIVQFY